MTDIEEQLGRTLASVAEQAPDAGGLAAGARRRHRVRRQRRIAVGGVAVALVVAVSAVAIGTRGGDDHVADPVPSPSADWQTIRHGDARAEVPRDWKSFECAGEDADPQPIYAPPGADACASGVGATFVPVVTEFEPGGLAEQGDGWLGHVHAGATELRVYLDDKDLLRQIVATMRLEGQPVVDGSQWVTFERSGMTYEVPAFWGVGEDGDRTGYAVCGSTDMDKKMTPRATGSGGDNFVVQQVGDLWVTASAPTLAVAEIVTATVEVEPGATGMDACTPEDFNVGLLPPEGSGVPPVEGEEPALREVQFGDVVIEVPVDWTLKNDCDAAGAVITPGKECPTTADFTGVRFFGSRNVDPVMGEGVLINADESGKGLWVAYVLRGQYAVYVAHPDKAVVELLLSKVRP